MGGWSSYFFPEYFSAWFLHPLNFKGLIFYKFLSFKVALSKFLFWFSPSYIGSLTVRQTASTCDQPVNWYRSMSLPDRSMAVELDTIRHEADYTDSRHLQAEFPINQCPLWVRRESTVTSVTDIHPKNRTCLDSSRFSPQGSMCDGSDTCCNSRKLKSIHIFVRPPMLKWPDRD